MNFTHWLIVDEDGDVLAWFPKAETGAGARAQKMADETGHDLVDGYWDGHWVLDGPEELKKLLSFG